MSKPGYLTAAELIEVEPGLWLERDTATDYLAARAEAKLDGVTLTIARPAGAYRDHGMDVDMHNRPWAYNINPAVGLYPVGVSKHALGICADVVSGLAWMIANGDRFNFTRPISYDVNHFQHHGLATAGTGTPITEKADEEMKIIRSGTVRLVGDYDVVTYTAMDFSEQANEALFGAVDLTPDQGLTLANEALARRAALIGDIVAELLTKFPATAGGSTASAASIAAEVETRLKDEFAAIPGAVIHAASAALSTP